MSYIITYYLPSGLFVVVSWISFLIPPDIVPGEYITYIRVCLGGARINNKMSFLQAGWHCSSPSSSC